MKVGFGRTIVTPPLGVEMAGYFSNRLADSVKDDLYSRAIVATDGDTHVALVVSDLIHFPKEDVFRVRRLIAEQTDIPEQNVMVAATHTHTGPVTRYGPLRDEDYMRSWAEKTAQAVRIAFENRVDATVGGGVGALPGVAFNRRFWMRNGAVHTNPGRGNPDVFGPAGPVDEEVIVLRFDDANGKPIGLLTNFACHTDTMGGTALSADWVGVTVRTIQSMLPHLFSDLSDADIDDFGIVVLNGACGDINHINVMDPNPNHTWPQMTHWIGAGLAAETMRVAMGISTKDPDGQTDSQRVAAASTLVELERIPHNELIAACEKAVADERVGRMERNRAQAFLKSEANRANTPTDVDLIEPTDIQVIQIGPASILGLPAETFSESGIRFKENTPHPYGMIANLANGALGYLPPFSAYDEGGYEVRSARFKPGSIEKMVSAGLDLTYSLIS